ncbi:MAG: PEP-CTERM system histidine kinase PrsK [Nitrospira sp.]|nr:PEP-CTERM system histidine kinase PrsK [Nitrospira sp.]
MAFAAAAVAGGLACLLFARRQAGSSHRSLAALFTLIALSHAANGLELVDEANVLVWRMAATLAQLFQPAALLYVGLAFLNPADREKNASVRWRARAVGLIGGLVAGVVLAGQTYQWTVFDGGQAKIALVTWGSLLHVFLIVGMALGLAQLELVLRGSHEPIRHRLKFIIIGLGGLAGYQIYQASRLLLVPVWDAEYVLVSSVVTMMALALIAYGLGRSRLRDLFVNIYVSQQALFGSVTFIVIGLYLLLVGAMGEWLRRTDQPLGVGLSVVVVFGALVGLAVAAFSKTVRAEIRRLVVRNFYRSKYDYRAKWIEVTDAFQGATNSEAIWDRLLDVLIKAFTTQTLSIWSFREADRRFCRIRSMTTDPDPAPLERSHPVIVELLQKDEPVVLTGETGNGQSAAPASGDPLRDADVALCFPIRAQGRLLAFVALGRQLHGEPYGVDDCDLLRGIAHHAGALLANARLAEEREASAELEALHRFSVFCLHDLKNLAARLSLVSQNAQRYGNNPDFQESAMRTVADTADKMGVLMSKLSRKSVKPGPAGSPEPVDLSKLIHDVAEPLRNEPSLRLSVTDHLTGSVMAVKEQIQQVLLNVVLNAKQAMAQDGEISVELAERDGWATVTVTDTGRGIPPAMLEHLFKPSQSSRPGGLGVGLYQCKQIVEAHQGTIQIRSDVGKGTEVTIELPLVEHRAGVKRET